MTAVLAKDEKPPTLTELREMREEIKNLFANFNTELEAKNKKDGLHVETVEKMNARLDELETALARPIVKEADTKNWEKPIVTGYAKWLANGDKAIPSMDEAEKQVFEGFVQKALSTQSDIAGGMLMPEDFRTEIISRLPYFANVSEYVTMTTTKRDSIRWPRQTHNPSSAVAVELGGTDIATSDIGVVWEDEKDEVTETDLSWGSVRIPTFRMRAMVRIPRELMEDSPFNIIDIISMEFARRFAIAEDQVFTKGSGGKKPSGFLTNSAVPTVPSGSGSNLITYNSIVDTLYAVPEQYAKNLVWMCKRTTVGDLRKIKDSQARPLWEPGVQVGAPATLMGHPLVTNEHLPATGVAGAKALICGDFKRLYVGVRKTGMTLQRLDEKYATTDEVAFIARQRLGGETVGEWAARFMTMS